MIVVQINAVHEDVDQSLAFDGIIVFVHDGILMVKRIYGIPGDEIDLESITYSVYEPKPLWEKRVINVPDGCYYVLGDNTQNSLDSRYWEDPFVRKADIISRELSLGGQLLSLLI